jgi:hypothetical protein
MTKGELHKLSKRLDEIGSLFETELPDDVYYNLQNELDQICLILEISLKQTEVQERRERIKNSGWKVVC